MNRPRNLFVFLLCWTALFLGGSQFSRAEEPLPSIPLPAIQFEGDNYHPVPEPGSLVLGGLGALLLAGYQIRRHFAAIG